jgi:chromosome segregation protein
MIIEWDKILAAPSKTYKIEGNNLVILKNRLDDFRKAAEDARARIKELSEIIKMAETENKKKGSEIRDLNTKIDQLKGLVTSMEKVVSVKDESLGATMNIHANFMKEIDRLSGELSIKNRDLSELQEKDSELQEKLADFEKREAELNSKMKEFEVKISSLNARISELEQTLAEKDDKITQFTTRVAKLEQENQLKDKTITDKTAEMEKLESKIRALNREIEDLKAKVPAEKKDEEIEGVVKSTPCPKCGFQTYDVYEMVDGKKKLIRQYCPNPTCAWFRVP